MIPGDGHFVPVEPSSASPATTKTQGRIFVLKFTSSSQRHIFWLQSKPQGQGGDPTWLSPRDRKIGEIVDRLLQGEEVEAQFRDLASIRNNNDDETDDETMEDIQGPGHGNENSQSGTGGAGAGATGGDIREEGEEAREGGEDGGRA